MRTPADDDPEMDREIARVGAGGDLDGGLADLMLSAHDPQAAALQGALLEMRDLGRMRVPHPSPELETLLTNGLPNLRRQRRRAHRRRVVVGTVLAGSMTMSLTGIAAANDRLPGASQGVIAGVINSITPFHIQDRRTRPVVPRVPEQAPERPAPADPLPSGEPSGDRGSESPEPGDTDDTRPGTQPAPTTPTRTQDERESEPHTSPASPREPSESEREGGA